MSFFEGSSYWNLCGNQPVSWVIPRNIAWTFVSLHAIEPTQLRRRHHADGVGRLKFDFHTDRNGPSQSRGVHSTFNKRE